jgi:hypothetical protein
MKILILVTITLKSIFSLVQQNNDTFLNKILSDYSRNSFYISVEAINQNKSFPVIINNEDLFSYFNKTKGLNKEQYTKYIKSAINDNKTISLTSSNISKYGFIKIKPRSEIDKEAKNGVTVILNKYFKNKVLVDGISASDRSYLIYLLFKWEIATKVDEESGYLIYEKQ